MSIKKLIVEMAMNTLEEAVAKIACLKCDEVSTAAAWKKKGGFCPKCKVSNQGVAEEVELDEISKETLNSYKKSAIDHNKSLSSDYKDEVKYTMNKYGHNHSVVAKDLKDQMKKREKYISLASKKLKEEADLAEDVHNDLNDIIFEFQKKIMRFGRSNLDTKIAKKLKEVDNDLDDLRSDLFKIRPGR
jgi:phage FluMu protein Com